MLPRVKPRGAAGAVKPVTEDAAKDGGRITKVPYPTPLQVIVMDATATAAAAPFPVMVRVDRSLGLVGPRLIVAITPPPVPIPVTRPRPPIMEAVRHGGLGGARPTPGAGREVVLHESARKATEPAAASMVTGAPPTRRRHEGPVAPAPAEREATDGLTRTVILGAARVPSGDAVTRFPPP